MLLSWIPKSSGVAEADVAVSVPLRVDLRSSSIASSVVSSLGSTGSRISTGKVSKVTRTAKGRISKLKRRAKKPVKISSKPKSAHLEKIHREKIDDEDFCLNELNWSSWKPAMAPVAVDTRHEWIERRGERPGVRNVDLFTSNCHKPALYEFCCSTA